VFLQAGSVCREATLSQIGIDRTGRRLRANGEIMKKRITINYNNGKSECYSLVFDETTPPEELQQLMETVFDGKLLRLRVQDVSLKHQDRLLLIPYNSIESISLDLPLTEYRFSNVIYVNPAPGES
jgi:hypothetical protein